MSLDRMNQRRQVLAAYCKILSWIHKGDMLQGDRLPPQISLSREIGVCQGTLSAAMALLVEDGVLMRKQKSGTLITSLLPKNPHRRIWTAGIVMPEFGASGYFAALTVQLHRELASRNFFDRTYFISPQSPPPSEVDSRKPSDFSGLEVDLEDGSVDALITSTRLVCTDVPCVTLGDYEHSQQRVCIDDEVMIERSIREFLDRGVRQVFIVGFSKDQLAFARLCSDKLETKISVRRLQLPAVNEWAGIDVASRYSDQVSKEDPAGVIIKDDFIAAVFAREVVRRKAPSPLLSLQTYRGSLLSYALPTLQFSIDLPLLSRTAVDSIVAQLLGTSAGEQITKIPLIFRDATDPTRVGEFQI